MNALTTTGLPKDVGELFNQIFNGQDLFPISRQE